MTDHLDATLNSETLPSSELSVQNITANEAGTASDIRVNDDSDNESEKPILLELGATSNINRTAATELTSIAYTSNYHLDFHLNSVYAAGMPTFLRSYSAADHALLYNQHHHHHSYNNGISAPTPSTDTSSLISLNNVPYSAHIPQTVYTWSTPTPVTSTTPNEVNKMPTEIVPSPVYMSYSDAPKHTISTQLNPSWKEKALQTEKGKSDYKRTACDRERTRMRDMNRAFDLLRSKLPISKPNGKKYSKIESLRIAINYMNHLQKILNDNTTDQTDLVAAKYLCEINVRRRSISTFNSNHKLSAFKDAGDKLKDLDESRSTWSDGCIPNSRDKWD